MRDNKIRSFKAAFGGIIAALSIVLMFSTGLIPTLTYAIPAICGALLMAVVIEISPAFASAIYVAVSILSLLVVADKEAAVMYAAFFGYYPIIKSFIERKTGKIASWVIKYIIFNIAMIINFDIKIHAIEEEKPVFEAIESYIKRMAKVENISYAPATAPVPDKCATAVVSASKIAIPLENLIDFNAEIARQEKKLAKLEGERKSLEGRINNPKFVANAPVELINQTKARIDEILVQEKAINDLITSLKA